MPNTEERMLLRENENRKHEAQFGKLSSSSMFQPMQEDAAERHKAMLNSQLDDFYGSKQASPNFAEKLSADLSPRAIALQMLRQRVYELDVRIHAHRVEEAAYHRKMNLVQPYGTEPEPPTVDSIDREVDYRNSDRTVQRLFQKREELILAMTIISNDNDLS